MSLALLLFALQAGDPIKKRPPARPKPPSVEVKKPTGPKANPTIIYAPAAKSGEEAAPAPAASGGEAAARPSGLSEAAVARILAERKANAERQAEHRKQLAEIQERVTRILAAETLDLDALKAVLVERDRVTTTYREQLTASVAAMLSEVPEAERRAVARAVIQGEGAPRADSRPSEPPKAAPSGR